MTDVKITVNGRVYRLACEDVGEARFEEIAEYVSATVEQIVDEFGQIGQDRLLILACLRLADELFDAQMPASTSQSSSSPAKIPASERPASERAASERPASDRPAPDRPASERPASERPASERLASAASPSSTVRREA